MGLGYGSKFEPAKLRRSEVGIIQQQESHQDLGWLSWLITGLEVALAFVPGVGWAAEAAIATAATAAQVGIDYAQTGKISTGTIIAGAVGAAIPIGGRIAREFSAGERAVEETAAKALTRQTEKALTREVQKTFELTDREIATLRAAVKDGVIVNKASWYATLRIAYKRTQNTLIEKALIGSKQEKLIKAILKKETRLQTFTRIARLSRRYSVKALNVMSNPNVIISTILKKTLGRVSRVLEEKGKEIGLSIAKWMKQGEKASAQTIEKAFIKSGGKLFKSRWVLGYKVIESDLTGAMILIQFKPFQTNSKEPVMVRLTKIELDEFLADSSKGSHYIDNFARSRGGRHAGDIGISGELATWLGFLPNKQIQEVLSVASATKRLANSAMSGKAIWDGSYWTSMSSSFKSKLINASIKEGAGIFQVGGDVFKDTIEDTLKGLAGGDVLSKSFATGFKSATSKQQRKITRHSTIGNNRRNSNKLVRPVNKIKTLTTF